MKITKVSINDKLSLFQDYWNPRIVGELNGQYLKVVKAKGKFDWHKHDNEDEMFLVIHGKLKMELRDDTIIVNKGELIIIPKGVEHRPVAEEQVDIMLFEPASTHNTGDNLKSQLSQEKIEWI
jgi:mannose-6-phosphate isomerase-like protein (cupin superfamily)